MTGVWGVAGAIIASFGGASVILLATSTWLGKVWAAKILEKDRAKYSLEIEGVRKQASEQLALLTAQLDIAKQAEIRIHSDKLQIYRVAIDIVAEMLVVLEKHQAGTLTPAEGAAAVEQFEKSRLQLYGYLGMLAPQAVMAAQDALMESLQGAIEGSGSRDWKTMRTHALGLLNEIRRDVGIDKDPIEYRGNR